MDRNHFRNTVCISSTLVAIILCCASAQADSLEDEFAKQAREYEQLFKEGKASALADLWTSDGTLESFDGKVFKGKAEIEDYFQKCFAANGTQELSVHVTTLRTPTENTVIEEGVTTVPATGNSSRYTVVHVKDKEGWKMAWVKESPAVDANTFSVRNLKWMAGKWKAKSKDGKEMIITTKPIEDGHFMECTTSDGTAQSETRQIIGYNPRIGTLISWHFDASGGFGHGQFAKVQGGWRQECYGVMADGTRTSAVYTVRMRNKDCFTWQSTERFIGGVRIPDSTIVVVNRVNE